MESRRGWFPPQDFDLQLIEVGGLNRVDFATRLKTLFDLPRAIIGLGQADPRFLSRRDDRRRRLRFRAGDAGGEHLSVPTVAFEPNVVPGFANRMVAPTVRAAAVHFEQTCQLLPQLPRHRRSGAARVFHLPSRERKCSSYAAGLRRQPGSARHQSAVTRCLPQLIQACAAVTHHSSDRRERLRRGASGLFETMAFRGGFAVHRRHARAFARADLLLCRSGASTVAEITAAGKPAIFIPLPTAADDHQRHNAATLAAALGPALLLPDTEA